MYEMLLAAVKMYKHLIAVSHVFLPSWHRIYGRNPD
jgi:hypothetical protein